MTVPSKNIALIGSGASAIYFLKHFLDHASFFKSHIAEISIFERSGLLGMGMPYSPETTDRCNMANIPSEEMPALLESFADWLQNQDSAILTELEIEKESISKRKIYSRIALGKYFQAQYCSITAKLRQAKIAVREFPNSEVVDLTDDNSLTAVMTSDGNRRLFDKVFIATGHRWVQEDRPESGYFGSPWPIRKLLPKEGTFYNFAVGTLGASLSAFDVIASLAHRHGTFHTNETAITFRLADGAEKFKILMHSAHGKLPHLRYAIEENERRMYRHVSRENLLKLVGDNGFLRIDEYYEAVCRPALEEAFEKDGLTEIALLLREESFRFQDFVEKMSDEHQYPDAFEGMRFEMIEARDSVLGNKPIHWKEAIDDLIYTLNFHAELMPAEDHIFLQSTVMPFLMNVIAAMPLHSSDKLLALHDAGVLEIISGKVKVADEASDSGETTVIVDDGNEEKAMSYKFFVDCSGQKPIELDDYPFPKLVKNGLVRKARAPFAEMKNAAKVTGSRAESVFADGGAFYYYTGGIDIDGTYRVIGENGEAHNRVYDLAFPHTSGVRPYSYGLQSCSDTGEIVVRALREELERGSAKEISESEATKIYEKI